LLLFVGPTSLIVEQTQQWATREIEQVLTIVHQGLQQLHYQQFPSWEHRSWSLNMTMNPQG